MGTAISDTAAIAITTTTAVLRNRCLIGYLLLIRRLAQMAVDQLFGVLHTLKLQLRRIPLQSAIKRKTYLPGFRKRLWVLDCRFVIKDRKEHTSELQSQSNLVCRLLLEKKNNN